MITSVLCFVTAALNNQMNDKFINDMAEPIYEICFSEELLLRSLVSAFQSTFNPLGTEYICMGVRW